VGKDKLLESMRLDEQFRGGDWTVTVTGWCTVRLYLDVLHGCILPDLGS
jgi:hypothetical protein